MNFNKKFTYIISFDQVKDDISNLNKVIKWLSPISLIDLVVVEYGESSPILNDKVGFNHIYFRTDGNTFSPSRAWNIGINYSICDYVFTSTSNDITDINLIIKSLKLLESGDFDMVKPYSRKYELNINEFKSNVSSIKTDNNYIGQDYEDERVFKICSGITGWSKKEINRICNWEERFKFWRYDYTQDYKLEVYSVKYTIIDADGYSLPHKRYHSDDMMSFDIDHYNKLKVLDNDSVKKYFLSSYGKSGNLMSYHV